MKLTDEQFLADFAEMSVCGATPGGGVDRQAATPEDHKTRAWFSGWLARHGFTESVDAIGNQFGMCELLPGRPWVLVGSHLDSQPLAGRYDGAYGVLAGAYAATRVLDQITDQTLNPQFNVAVVNWFNEEGSRFAPSLMGSSVFTGKLPLEKALATRDHVGVTVAEALGGGTVAHGPAPTLSEVAHYAEIHIEQGRVLEDSGINIGLVDRTWAASKYRVRVVGSQSHTGSTRMEDRQDALYGASLIITAVRELTEEFEPGRLHSSVSELYVLPNSPVTVAREVTMNVDLRSPDEAVLARAVEMLAVRVAECEARSRTRVLVEPTHSWGLLAYPPAGVALARSAARELGLSYTEVMTVAGHDSTNLKDVVPTVMLFVPSVAGISHNEMELTRDGDALRGVRLLTEVLGRLVSGNPA
ncbi:M20 family metallo-hydrolase [Lysinibacter sp. HNR]|uniref:M20 family metallo-hydrolase n=1 Tax=Lysinibacter sp. HNR TaxID=3031408 RepID=UPI0024357DF9|nr:M20 family metallo-hydrolase [Lysinibacter sp. HNR]WGD37298.1 M20 family metallo-hydrolase [Lysinibacter sp. HNR]